MRWNRHTTAFARLLLGLACTLGTVRAANLPAEGVTMAFRPVQHLLTCPGRLDGMAQPATCILDTGAGLSVVDKQQAAELHLAKIGEVPARDTSGRESRLDIVRVPGADLGGLRVDAFDALASDFTMLDKLTGERLLLIVGDNVLRQQRFTVDWRGQRVTFGGPAPAADGAVVWPARPHPPYEPISVALTVDGHDTWAAVDTGAADFSLPFAFLAGLPGPPEERREASGSMSAGLLGDSSREMLMRSGQLQIGPSTWRHFPIHSVAGMMGLIGHNLLGQYLLSIDYQGLTITLRPYEGAKVQDNESSFGAAARKQADGSVTVIGLWPGSSAAKAGIKVGDRIEAIDGQPVEPLDQATLGRKFSTPAKPRMTLTVRGAEGPRTVEIEYAPLFAAAP